MKTVTKLNIAGDITIAIMTLNTFSHLLGIPENYQLLLSLVLFIPLGLCFVYIKQLKTEKAALISGRLLLLLG